MVALNPPTGQVLRLKCRAAVLYRFRTTWPLGGLRRFLVERSPLTSAAKIKTPLMIAQGANDPRVNHAESEQIVVALRDRGFPVEYLLIPDEGHGFARPINNMASFMATEKFFAKYLSGRYQEGGTP